MEYGQFCPVAKASEIIGEKWTILVIREILVAGCSRFSELQRGLGSISPTLLTKRLNDLVDAGLLMRKKMQGRRGFEYFPTESCEELRPIILGLGNWGMKWTRQNLTTEDHDPDLLMHYLQRSIMPEKLPGTETVIRFSFADLKARPHWWLVVKNYQVDTCDRDPGKDVDLYINTTVVSMVDIWTGRQTYRKAKADNNIEIVGPAALTRNVSSWMNNSVFANES